MSLKIFYYLKNPKKSKHEIFNFKKFIWLQYGNCILIFRVIYVTLFIMIIIILGVFNYTTIIIAEENYTNEDMQNDLAQHPNLKELVKPTQELLWEELLNECGAKFMVENNARANEIFKRKYYKKLIKWRGYFISAFKPSDTPLDFNQHQILNINIRMIPSESINSPDLILILDGAKYNRNLKQINNLKKGDPILFKAKFESLGNEWGPHILHLTSFDPKHD